MTEEVKRVRAKAIREGFSARFFERGGKFRVDFFEESEQELRKIREGLGRHFLNVLKVVFRGRGGGEKERWISIFAFLYYQGKIREGERIIVELSVEQTAAEEREEVKLRIEEKKKAIEGALRELEGIDEALAKVFGERKAVGGNRIILKTNNLEVKNIFEGEGRKEFFGMSAEEYFYREVLVPTIIEMGGEETDIIPQMEFGSILDDGRDARRMDFFLSNRGEKNMVIEIDDATHEGREQKDTERDASIRGSRMRVFRIKDSELKDKERAKRKFKNALKGFYEARDGVLERERIPNRLMAKNRSERELEAFNAKILVGDEQKNEIFVREISFPYRISNFLLSEGWYERRKFCDSVELREGVRWLLKYIFGFEEFREGQIEAILKVLEGEDVIVLLPTGAGKSIIYQMLYFLISGAVLVVEPLRALMEDQVANLGEKGIEIGVNMSAEMTLNQKKRMMRLFSLGEYGICYVTPERMQMEEFRSYLEEAKVKGVVFEVVALDEAHCVSEWGHDFRVSYLNLPDTARKFLKVGEDKPRILALTGTASDNVLKDMERDIGISEEKIIQPESFDRPEMHFRVIKVDSGEKLGRLEKLIDEMGEDFPECSREELRGIIFCIYKSGVSDFGVDAVYRKFAQVYGEEHVTRYYGGEEKAIFRENVRRFREDEAELMIATKAFGMGIDKKNVRFTVHYGITNSIEAFYQEAGRAGRDGKRAMAYILLSNDFPERNRELLTGVSIEEMNRELKVGGKNNRDDLNRVLFLHQKNYNKRLLLAYTKKVLGKIGKISEENDTEKHISAENRLEFEEYQKVLFRLKILGVVGDYAIFDYANNEFLVLNKKFNARNIVLKYGEYVARYQEGQKRHEMNKIRRQVYKNQGEFILAQMEILIDFANEVFEKSRRRAILNMLELAEAGAKIEDSEEADKEIRRRILNYLGANNKDLLKKILDDKKIVRFSAEAIFRVRKKDEEGLFAETKRTIESYPEHPGLLILSGGLGLIDEKTEVETAVLDFLSARENIEKYEVSSGEFFRAVLDVIKCCYTKARDEEKFRRGIVELERNFREERAEFREELLEILPERFTYLFQGEVLIENMMISFSKIKGLESDLWTGKN
ncbi:RecQ family ATP-dependent DNA helicase [Candidatus Saccharibacteria bacterium]|nr:RecQ family ATP-dependent DNA helicase [Candidatus Saccharibacteria bacterium]